MGGGFDQALKGSTCILLVSVILEVSEGESFSRTLLLMSASTAYENLIEMECEISGLRTS